MKKVFVLLAILCLGTGVLSACRGSAAPTEEVAAEILPTAYEISATLSPQEKTLSVVTEIRYSLPTEGVEEIPLRLYANLYREGNLPVREERFADVYEKGVPSYGSAKILSVTSGETPLDHSLNGEGTLLTVRLPARGRKGERVTLRIEEEILLANCKHRLGYYDGYFHLSRFYPEICPYREGGFLLHPLTPYGDPFVTDASDFSVTLTLPGNYAVAASAIEERREYQGTLRQFHYSLQGARDFAVVTSPKLRVRSGEAGGIPVLYYFASDARSAEILEQAKKSLSLFTETFGDYPYPAYTLVTAPFFEAGMEHSGLSVLSTDLSAAERQVTVTHETAHQWWFGKVGFDEFSDPWMDEGLAEYATAYFYKAQGSDAAYRSMVKQAESDYAARLAIKGQAGTRADLPLSELEEGYYDRVYAGGLLLFHALAEKVGHDRLNAALRLAAERFAGSILSPDDLIATLSECLARDYTSFFRLRLSASLPPL